jgi:hypothetical protein
MIWIHLSEKDTQLGRRELIATVTEVVRVYPEVAAAAADATHAIVPRAQVAVTV